jgi:tetratricopeptide (TPR) repeat protein
MQVLGGLFQWHLHYVELDRTLEVAHEALTHARSTGFGPALCSAHVMTAVAQNALGEWAMVEEHAEQALAFYDPEFARRNVWLGTNDSSVSARAYLAIGLWHRGRDRRARELEAEALARAAELGHPSTEIFALIWVRAVPDILREDWNALAKTAASLEAHPSLPLLPNWHAYGRAFIGWSRVTSGQAEAGMRDIEGALRALAEAGSTFGRPFFLAALAAAHVGAGRSAEAARTLREAIALAERTRELQRAPQFWRQLASLGEVDPVVVPPPDAEAARTLREAIALAERTRELQRGPNALRQFASVGEVDPVAVPPADAEAALGSAIRMARDQGSLMQEIYAACDLARRLAASGREAAARDLLSELLARARAAQADEEVLVDAQALMARLSA